MANPMDTPQTRPALFQTWRQFVGLALFALIYWLFVRIGLLLVVQPEGVASIWPVSGLALAVLLLRHKREWPWLLTVIFATNTIGNWSSGSALPVSLGFALANTLEPALCAWVIISLCKSWVKFDRTPDIFALLVATVFVNGATAFLGAVIPALAYGSPIVSSWQVWAVADGLGMIMIAPLIVTWSTNLTLGKIYLSWRSAEIALVILALSIFAWLTFGPFTAAEDPLLRTYMIFPLLIWLAFRVNVRGMITALLPVAVIAVWNTSNGHGMFALPTITQAERLISAQLYLFVTTFSGLLISIMVAERNRDNKKLKIADANYRAIFENAPVGFFQSAPSGCFLNVNPKMAQVYGFGSPSEMLTGITDISRQIYVNSTERDEFQRILGEQGQIVDFVTQNRRKDGSVIWTNTNARAVKDLSGKTLYYEGFLDDITKSKQAEDALGESERNFRILFDTMTEGVALNEIIYNENREMVDYRILNVNTAYYKTDNFSDTKVIGNVATQLYKMSPEFIKAFWQEHRNRNTTAYTEIPGPVGQKWFFVATSPFVDDRFVTSFFDITERKQVEKALRESEEKYRKLFSEMTSGCSLQEIICDDLGQPVDYVTLDANDAFEKLMNTPRAAIIGTKASETLPQEELRHWLYIFGPVALTGQSAHYEMYSPFNKKHFEGVVYSPRKGRFAVVFSDDTARKQAEEKLRESEARYRLIAENSADVIWILDVETQRFKYVSPSVERLRGYTPEEVIAQPMDAASTFESNELVRELLVARAAEFWADAPASKTFVDEVDQPCKDGSFVHTEITTSYVLNAQGKLEIIGVSRDITARKHAEDALRAINYRLEAALEVANMGAYQYGKNFTVITFDPRACRILGLDDIGQPRQNWAENIYADDQPLVINLARKVEQGNSDDETVEYRYNHPTKGIIWLRHSVRVLKRDAHGAMLSQLGIVQDITERKLAEDALRKSEEKYRTVADFTYDWETWRAPNGSYLYVSPSCKRISGHAAAEFLSDPRLLVEITHPDDRPLVIKHLGHSTQETPAHSEELEFRIVTPDGETRWVSHSCVGVYGEDGKWLGRRGSNHDITERKMADDAVRASEERYRRLTAAITDYIYTVRVENGQAVDTNHGPGCVAVTGYTSDEFAADPYLWYRMIWPEDRGLMQGDIQNLLAGYDILPREHRITRKDGQVRWIRDTLSPHFNKRNELVGYDGLIQDITERKLAEEALRESEEHYRRIIDTAYEGIWVVDETYQATFINARMEEMLGYSADEMLGKRVDAFLYETDLNETRQINQHLHHTGGQQERRFRRKDGSELWTLVSAKPILDNKNVFKGSFAMFSDITERKQAEAALQKFAFIANTAPEFMSLLNRRHVYESVNDAYCRARGKPRSEFIGHSAAEIWDESLYRKRLLPYLERCFAGEIVRYEETFVFSALGLRNYQVGMYPYRPAPDEPVTHVVVVTSDITEFKNTEAALRRSESNLNKAQHFAQLGSWTWNIKTNHLEWSDEMYNIFDIDKETFTGSLPDVILRAIHPDDRAKVNESNARVINEGKPMPVDYRVIRRDGSIRVVWAEAGELVRDETGQPSFLSGTVQDITERKQMEEDLRASLAEKEALLKEVHHRVKNNLQIISSLLSMQASNSQNELVTYALDESRNRVRAMALIHEKLYQSKNLECIDADEYVSELVEYLLSSFAGQMRNISFDLQVASLTLDINKAIPCGMIINELVSNALKYAFSGQEGGLVKIVLGVIDGKVRLVISDNGVGLPTNIDVLHPETLGLELVSILSHQLKASLEVARWPGTTYTITFAA